MNRMSFIPGPTAKGEIHEAEGRIFFGRAAALDYADEFIGKALGGGIARSPHIRLLYQLAGACLSEGDLVDIWSGLRSPDTTTSPEDEGGEERVYPRGEDIGHTWALLTHAAEGRKQTVWEVGRDTPFPREAYARRAFDGYRKALAEHIEMTATPPPSVPGEAGDGGEDGQGWPTNVSGQAGGVTRAGAGEPVPRERAGMVLCGLCAAGASRRGAGAVEAGAGV